MMNKSRNNLRVLKLLANINIITAMIVILLVVGICIILRVARNIFIPLVVGWFIMQILKPVNHPGNKLHIHPLFNLILSFLALILVAFIGVNTRQFQYFCKYLDINGLNVLMPYAEETLRYVAANGSDAWEYLKNCGVKGFEFLKSCGEAGLDYILSFGKAGLNYLLSFGEDGWNFLMSYYDTPKVIRGLSGDIPELGRVSPNDDKSVKNYLETYKTLGRDVFDTYGNDAIDVLHDWTPGGNNSAVNDSIVDTIIPDSVNINEAYEIKKFLEADSLEWIDFIPDFRDREYFREGSLIFCREYSNSLSRYGFPDSDYLVSAIKKFYGGGFSVHDSRNFTFRLSGSTVLWNSTIKVGR